jgi:hypothetical protein
LKNGRPTISKSKDQWLDKARFVFFPGAFAVTALATTSANAADVAGKWYGRLDSEPVITINKAGPAYSASLDYPDTTKSVQRPNGLPDWPESTHKEISSFEVAGNTVHFTIRNEISRGGDTNYARDEYKLTLSEDGRQMIGTVARTFNYGSGLYGSPPPFTVTPITLFPTDWNTRSQP